MSCDFANFEQIFIYPFIQHTQIDMESVDNDWRDELKKYFFLLENLTEKALLLIKRDRIRNNEPFDDSFKKYFLDRTNFR